VVFNPCKSLKTVDWWEELFLLAQQEHQIEAHLLGFMAFGIHSHCFAFPLCPEREWFCGSRQARINWFQVADEFSVVCQGAANGVVASTGAAELTNGRVTGKNWAPVVRHQFND